MTWARRLSAGVSVAWACDLVCRLVYSSSAAQSFFRHHLILLSVSAPWPTPATVAFRAQRRLRQSSRGQRHLPQLPRCQPPVRRTVQERLRQMFSIKELADTQKALKEQRKQCSIEMKNAVKRKKRLQEKARSAQRHRSGGGFMDA